MQRIWQFVLFTLALGLVQPQAAFAQVSKQSQDIFNNMINVTNPQVSLDARRGMVTGGGFTIRTPIQNIPFYNIQLPRIDAGCGGIDAFMGSFSFISGDQLVAALRNIASAALGYAFQLALKAMCPTCEDVMSKLQAMMNSFNGGAMNTCKLAKTMMDAGGKDSVSNGITNAFQTVGQETGVAGWSNYFDSMLQGQTNSSTNSVFAAFAPQQAQELMWGNVVWKTMMQSNAAGAFIQDGNTSLLQDLMSVTGTVVVCMQGVLGCDPGDQSQQQMGPPAAETMQVYSPVMSVQDIVLGTQQGPSQIERYQCDTTQDQYGCLKLTKSYASDMIGVKQMIENIMLGAGGNEGMIDAMHTGDRQPTNQEMSLMVAGGEYIQLALKLGRKNATSGKEFVMMFSNIMATEFVVELIDADVAVMVSSLSGRNQSGVDANALAQARTLVQDADKNAHADLMKAYAAAKNNDAVLAFYNQQVQVMSKSTPPVQPIGMH